jgi:glyoxylase-like metal-dependent hydrolase (beta-lactamase superfamily II)
MIRRIELPTPYYVGPVNVWLVKADAVVLVDCGIRTAEARAALEAGLRKHGVSFGDVDAVLLTHSHPDHFGLASEIRDRSGARILAHGDERRYLEGWPERQKRILEKYEEMAGRHGIPPEMFGLVTAYYQDNLELAKAVPLDREVADGERVEFGRIRLTAVHTPGHTSGSICWHGQGGIFSGDTVLEGVTPVTFLPGKRERTGVAHFRASLAKLKGLEVRAVWPGHRRKFEDFAGAIRRIERHLELRERRILGAMDGPRTAMEIAAAAFPASTPQQQWVSFAETVGLLEDLASRRSVRPLPGSPLRFARNKTV